MQYTVIGDANQCVVAQMTNDEEIRAEPANLILLSDGVALEAGSHKPAANPAQPPVLDAPVPLTHFRCMASLGVATFAAPYCGETRKLEIHGGAWLCTRDSFLFCSRDVTATVGMVHSIATGYFSEGGYVLYRLGGHGEAFIHCGGNAIEYDLVAGQRVTADAGCIAAYQDTVPAATEAVEVASSTQHGTGSLFLVTLTGPGKIYLATLPLSRIQKH